MSITISGDGDINATGNDIELNSTGTTDVTLALGGGSVGIGTATPTKLLDVNGSVAVTDITPSSGIYLGGTGSANLLQDYETGSWSPYWCDSNGNAIFDTSPVVNFAEYTKVGNYVTACCYFNMPSSFGTTSYYGSGGALRLGGLPFTAYVSGANNYCAGSVGWFSSWSWDASGYGFIPMIYTRHNTTVLNLVYPSTNGISTILMQNVNVGGSGMIVTATYFTAS